MLFQLGQDAQRLVRNLELADAIDQDLIRDINERRAELRARRSELGAQLAAAENDAREERSPALLDQLPVTPVDLAGMPDEVSRPLFEALRLEIRYDFTTRIATCQITLTGQTVDAVARTSRQKIPSPPRPPARHAAPPNRRRKRHRHPKRGMVCVAPPVGFEPTHTAPEAVALSPELWGLARSPGRHSPARPKTQYQSQPVPSISGHGTGSARIISAKPIASRG